MTTPPIVSKLLDRLLTRPKYRLGNTQSDFDREGLTAVPEAWEDGRRIRWKDEEFEWWYFDAHFEDGSTAVGSYAINWKEGAHVFGVRAAITTPSGETHSTVVSVPADACRMLCGGATVTMGPHRFEGGLDEYHIVADAGAANGIGWDLTLERKTPSYRPANGFLYGGERYFAWFNAVPDGEITGTLTYEGKTVAVRGSGYHDHNWGDAPMASVLSGWTWGRVKVGELAVVAANVRPHARLDGPAIPLMLVTSEDGALVDVFGDDVTITESDLRAHPDSANKADQIPYTVEFRARQGEREAVLTFRVRKMIESVDLVRSAEIGAKPWQIDAATLLGMTPWYTRVLADATLTITGESPQTAVGTLEFMDFS
jgi:hypothetical protein